ncbi:hemagglutinin repeat-containing protein [Hydrogenophaga sp.]|uniref:hemagglutinin repeat-containing protein n=1 Tax=Hydrogenophaga sp. TaxID=1904254 RepID=UPI0025C63008|nr:hemagglutinin repeat-containing protein [Hydrogenophaga sp.]MBT9463868.1 hemagglutinin repeat-containing protein [Hydrogenophaga sp.]
MNRNHHRIVFNAARGQLMAVSETASSGTCSSTSGEAPACAARPKRWRRARHALLLAFCAVGLPAQSQITADPSAAGNLRPTVLTAPNGTPLVNIQTPSAAGVSRNVYRQFDVGAQGAILNNSRTDVQTQLGGWVGANPWLATGPARVILNEVNSSQPTQLSGWVEVGGQRAEVVIANPAGINVNGAVFINASRATLTTGVPVLNAGALEGFRVQGGQVKVEGLGLDVTQTDHAAILARAVELNAGVWANAITVVTGANEVSADISAVTPSASTSSAPAFALDVAALGGMYAGKIHLIGTEAGVGVRNAGKLSARSGDLVLDANGWLHNSGSLVASSTLDLKTSGLTQHGLIDALTTRITTGDLLNEGSGWIEGDTLDITTRSLTNDRGAVVAARHTLTTTTATLINREGALLLSGGDMALSATDQLENRSASFEALGNLSITTPVLENSGSLISSQTLHIQSRDITQHGLIDAQTTRIGIRTLVNEGSGRIYGDTIDIQADAITNDTGAVIAARRTLSATTGTLVNREGALLLSAGDMSLVATERLENRSADVEALGKLSITTPVLVNANDHISHTVVTDAATNHTVYHLASGTLDANDVAWSVVKPLGDFTQDAYDAHRREWLLPKTSAYADPAFKTYYLGALPFVAGHNESFNDGESGSVWWVGDTFTYSRLSPIWAHFGMTAPTWDAPGQMPAGTYDGEGNLMSPPDPQAVAIWQAQAAPWVELTTRVASFKTAAEGQFLRFDAYSSYTQTSQRAVMTRSEPARIVSGGDMHLTASQSLLNQDSEIVAGGALTLTGVHVSNLATEVSAPTSRSGTFSSWGVTGRDCDLFGCDPEYGWIHTPYAETIAQTVPLPALRYASHSAAVPTSGTRPPLSPNLNNALFTLSLDPASRALFQSDPRFAGERPWLSSDHLLGTLGLDPTTTQKRLGDGFIEQRLIREQVGALTGQRFLGDFTDDEQQYLALMTAGATFAQAHQLRPGISLSAEQVAALTSDIVWLETQTITLPDGSTTQALVPRVYLLPRAGDLSADGALMAGRDVQMNLDGDVLNTGRIAGQELVRINARNLHNTGLITGQTTALSARDDVTNIGGTISATDALLVQAGHDLNVQTTTASGQGAVGVGRYSSEQVNRVAGLYVSGEAGVLLASAGRDVNLTAAALQADSIQVDAGRDLNLSTVNTARHLDAMHDARNFARVQQSAEVGTRIQGTTITLQAGQDITTRAASVQAQGALAVQAGRDIALTAGESSYQIDHGVYAKSSGLLGSSSIETRTHNGRTDAVGTALGGSEVLVQGGQDITLTGSSAIADDAINLTAGRDVNITAAQTRSSRSHFREEKASGLLSSGAGVTLGSQQHSTEQQNRGTGAAASTVGAIGGDVSITAGRAYAQTGSDVLAPGGDIIVQAQSIAITEARTTERSTTEEKFKQGGISFGMGGALVEAAQGVMQMVESVSQTQDLRMQALGAATATLQGYSALQGLSKPASGSGAKGAGVSVSISIGGSQSESRTESQRNNAHGSTITAGGDVNLSAAGEGDHSDIHIQGGQVKAGQVASLSAEGDVQLLAATHTTQESSRSKNRSASIGISLGAETGITVAASAGKSHGSGEETAHSNTRIEVGDQVRIDSGGNTALRGAVVAAPKVQARIGGDLVIESLQDTSVFHEQSKQTGGSVTFGPTPGASISASKTRIDSHLASVGEQAAIRAGDGGFDVSVRGATDLQGGAITSTQVAINRGLNAFESAGGLTTSDIHNSANFKASSSGFTAGVGSQLGSSGAGIGSDKGSASSVTAAAISGVAGNTAARTGDAENGLTPIFDKERVRDEVEAQVAITKAFGQQTSKAIGQYSNGQLEKAKDLKSQAAQELDAASREALLGEAQALEETWKEGGAGRVALHMVAGALGGGAGGAAGAGLTQSAIPTLGEHIAALDVPVELKQAMVQTMALALGGSVGGSSGAAAALNATSQNYLTATDLRNKHQKLIDCRAAGDGACELRVLKEYDLKNVRNSASIDYRSVLTEGALQADKALLEEVLNDPSVSEAAKAEARRSIRELDNAVHVIQRSPVLRDAAELGLIALDVITMGQLAAAKVLTSTLVREMVLARTGKEIGEAEAYRIANNVYRDDSIADPARAMSPLGDWKPAAVISGREADVMIAQRLPEGARVTEVIATNKANAEVLAADALFKPPYIPNAQIVTVQTTQPDAFVRVFVQEANKSELAGTWMMRAKDIKGLSPEQIASKYALPQVPTHVADVSVPAGNSLRVSVANDVHIKQGLGGNGGGGGVQFEVLSRPSVDADFERWFTNPRRLP